MKKVYIVQYARGEYDSYKTFIYKICSDRDDAEKTHKALSLEWEIKANVPCPVEWDTSKPCPFSSANYPYVGDEKKYWQWYQDIYYAKDFKPLPIAEYEMEKEYIYERD